MKRILILGLAILSSISAFSQVEQLFQKADSAYFDFKDYSKALGLYRQIEKQLDTTNKDDYAYTVDKIAKSLFYLELQTKTANDWKNSIELSEQFIPYAEKNRKYISDELYNKKYFMYKNIVVGYFGLGQKNKAKPWQQKLYAAYKEKELPEGINQHYNFEKFVFNNLNIWGYEWYANIGDKEAEGSFSKIIYYVYTRDSAGNDKDQLYTLEAVKIHKREKDDLGDFVLTKRIYSKTGKTSESIWSYTFADPIDYDKIRKAVVEYLKGNVTPDTYGEMKYNK